MPAVVSSGAAAAAGIAAWGAVAPTSQLFGPTLRYTDSPRKIALTFDDGPNPAITPLLLELLDRYTVRATFFLIGKFARACPELVKEISTRGHLIGNHTDSHRSLIFQSRAEIRDELARCQESIAAVLPTGPPRWMRPPYGYRSPLLNGEIRRTGIKGVVMWSKTCLDWKPQPPDRLIARLACVARPKEPRGDIVLMHDGDHRALGGDRRHIVTALEHWLPRWRDAGMEFVTMDSPAAMEGIKAPRS